MKSPMIQTLEDTLLRYIKEREIAEDAFVGANYIGDKLAIINSRVEMIGSYENIRITESKLKIALARGRYESNPAS